MAHIDHRKFLQAEPGLQPGKCQACQNGQELPFRFTMAFQPIVDLDAARIWGYEALVRGENGSSAESILDLVDNDSLYAFDQACRVKAIELAAPLMPRDGATRLSINFKPNAVYEPSACIRATLAAARKTQFDQSQLMFEFTEDEPMRNVAHVRRIIETYRGFGFTTAIDDFGAGYAGLSLLADLMPDLIKIDMGMIRGIDSSPHRKIILRSIAEMANALGIACLAEGLETRGEVETVREIGINLCQGFYFAQPELGRLPEARLELPL